MDATLNVPRAIAYYSPAAGTILNACAQTLTATFTPANPLLKGVSKQVTLTVLQAPQTITFGTIPETTAWPQTRFR